MVKIQISKLNEAIEIVKDGLGSSLIATEIWSTEDGVPIVGYNENPGQTALMNKVTAELKKGLTLANATLGKYYLIDLAGGSKVMIIPMNDYEWGVVVDKTCQIGFLLHVMLPKMLDKFEEAALD